MYYREDSRCCRFNIEREGNMCKKKITFLRFEILFYFSRMNFHWILFISRKFRIRSQLDYLLLFVVAALLLLLLLLEPQSLLRIS